MAIQNNINLKEIVELAITTFPPIEEDNDAARNYAQRILSKIFSEKRKAKLIINENEAQEIRQALDQLFLEIVESFSADAKLLSPALERNPPLEESVTPSTAPDLKILKHIITGCFHTATDGSKLHQKLLQQRAMKEAKSYLAQFKISWLETRILIKEIKNLIQEQLRNFSNA